MIRDEFNKIEITNDKQLKGVEFGKTQKVEFTAKQENEAPEGDLNEKYVGKTIKKETEINVDYINKVPTHATQTVVTSSTTATTAAAATATTAVVASTVAVVAVATATGISIALHDYKFTFEEFVIMSNQLVYGLTIFDQNDDTTYLEYEQYDYEPIDEREEDPMETAPFLLRVSNREYNVAQPIFYHSSNYGVFEDLILGDTYSITLTENRYGGETIYSETFTTYTNNSFNGFTFTGSCDKEYGYFEVEMDFVDEEDYYSNFELFLYDKEFPEEIYHSFTLEKVSGIQYVYVTDEQNNWIIDLNREWGYQFSYSDRQETIKYAEGTVSFYDWQGRESIFREFILDREANYKENSINIQLDYQDDFAWYDDFKLTLTLIPTEEDPTGATNPDDYYSQEISLQSTSEVQTIVLDEYEMYVRDSEFQYTYRLTCNYRGEEIILDEETTPFSFTDMSGAKTEFRALEFSKEANFLTNTFKVRLDYDDDFNRLYGFTLHLLPSGVNAQYDFTLQETTEEQTCTFNENEHWNFSFDYEYGYFLTYYDGQEEIKLYENSESFKFTDISGGKSEVTGITFDGTYDMGTGNAAVQLDYQDDFGYLDNFVLHLSNPIISSDGPGGGNSPFRAGGGTGLSADDYPHEISLEKTTEVQYFNVHEYELEIEDGFRYNYALTYDYRGETQDPIEGTKPIEFNDPDALSEVRGITFVNGEANFIERSFMVQLDFDDDYGYYSRFTLQMRDNTNGGWVERELQYTTEPQKVIIDDYDYENYIYPVDIVEGDLTYNLTYVTAESGDPSTQYFYQTEPSISFVNSLHSEFYGLETPYDFRSSIGSDEYLLPFRFDCVNDAEYFSAPELYFTPVDDEDTILATISFANEVMDDKWQYGSFSASNDFTIEQLTNGDAYNVMVAFYEKEGYNGSEQRVTRKIGEHAFTINQVQEIHGIGLENYVVAGSWQASFEVVYSGDLDNFTNATFIMELSTGETLSYSFEVSQYSNVYLIEANERTLTEEELEAILDNPVKISITYSKVGTSKPITLECFESYQFSVSH